MSLLDRNLDVLSLTRGMSVMEKKAYDLGVIASVQALLNELQDSKENTSNTLLGLQESNELSTARKLELLSRLHILDVYSDNYANHLDKLCAEFL